MLSCNWDLFYILLTMDNSHLWILWLQKWAARVQREWYGPLSGSYCCIVGLIQCRTLLSEVLSVQWRPLMTSDPDVGAVCVQCRWHRGEDRAGPPQRGTYHWAEWRTKHRNLQREQCHCIPALHWAGETGVQNTQKIPTPRGHAHRTGQHNNGRTYNPTTPPGHISVGPSLASESDFFCSPSGKAQRLHKNTKHNGPSFRRHSRGW